MVLKMSDTINMVAYDREGNEYKIEAPTDMNLNVMEVMKGSGMDVKATCGGMALCSTCHIYIISDHQPEGPGEDEEDMLDQAFDVEDNSRLGCQLKIDSSLDGLVVKLAPQGS